MITSDNKYFKWAILPIVLVIAIVEPVWLEVKRLLTDSLFVPTLKENFKKIKEIYFN